MGLIFKTTQFLDLMGKKLSLVVMLKSLGLMEFMRFMTRGQSMESLSIMLELIK
jgi:hypothetical protein